MEKFSPKKLVKALAEKHARFITEYSVELDTMKKIHILQERRDQLMHWVDSKDKTSKYAVQLKATEDELASVKASIKPKPESYYSGLSQKIDENKKAQAYWTGRVSGLKS